MSRPDIMAGRAYVSLYVNQNGLTKGLNRARQRLSQFGSEMQSFGRSLITLSAGMLVPLALASKTFADFDDAMRAVKAVTGATESEFAKLTETAKQLGRTTSFTAIEVASLMTELGRAGFDTSQIDNMTGSVLALARATSTDATLASGIMAASIRQFGLGAGDASRVADSLTAAANKSFNTVEQLGEALSYAGPVAADFGMSIEDTLAILGGLGNVGIQASNAGTAVRRLLTLNGAEAEKLNGIFGVAFKDSEGNARPLVDVLGEVNTATQGLGTAARAEKFNEAFGLLGITGASAIGKSVGDIKSLAEEIKNAGGIAEQTAAEMDAGLGGSFRIFMSALEGVKIALGESLEAPLQSVVDAGAELLGMITQIVAANKPLIVSFAKWGAVIGVAGASLLAVGITASMVSVSIGGLMAAVSLASAAFALVVLPLHLVSAAIATVRVAMVSAVAVTAAMRAAIIATVAASTIARAPMLALAAATVAYRIAVVSTTAAVALFRAATVSAAAVVVTMRSGLVATRTALIAMASGATAASIATKSLAISAAIIGALTSPIALTVAGIALLGTYAVRSAGGFEGLASSGNQALGSIGRAAEATRQNFVTAFGEIRETAGIAIGGIRDAFAAGDVQLAGQIAMTSMRLVVMQGMQAISQSIGGSFGDALSKITSQIMGGDFAGAFATAVTGMSQIWQTFSNSMVTGFVNASKSVLKVWRATIDSMANSILQAAGQGGIFGAIFESYSGVNVQEEMAKNAQLRSQEGVVRSNFETDIKDIESELSVATDPEQIRMLNEQLEVAKQNLADLDGGRMPDIFDQVANGTFSDPATEALADQATSLLDQYQQFSDQLRESADQAGEAAISGGADEASETIDKLQGDLLALRGLARFKRDAADREPGDPQSIAEAAAGGAGGRGGASGSAGPTLVTSSAAGLIAASQGAQQDSPVVRELREQRKQQKQIADKESVDRAMMLDALGNSGIQMV